jgi:uncharacterized protein
MSIKNDLNQKLKEAMKNNDIPVKNVVRCIKARVEEHLCAHYMQIDLDDDSVYLDVITKYKKSISNALELIEKTEKGQKSDLASSYRYELDFCDRFLPTPLTDQEICAFVKEKIKALGDNAKLGVIIGAVLKEKRPGVCASVVKRLVTQIMDKK